MKRCLLTFLMTLAGFCAYSQMACEGFEGAWPPTGWGIYQNNVGLNQFWVQGVVGQPAFEGQHSAYLNRENVATGLPEDWLITPAITAPNHPQVRFYSQLTLNGDQGSIYEVRISTSATQSDLASYTLVEDWTETEINPSAGEWREVVVNIPESYAGQTVYVAFVMKGDFADRWFLDKVCVVERCLDPENLTADNISQDSAELSWDNPSGATQWEIEVKPATVSAVGAGVIYSGPQPYLATGLQPDTAYKYFVRAICGNGAVSEWEGPFNFVTKTPGEDCNAPIVITSLPYTTTDNTQNYGVDYSGSPGSSCGTTDAYLDGNDVVYSYTPTQNQFISINLTNITDQNAGVFVYTSCDDIGVNCYDADFNGWELSDLNIESMQVTANQTYYILISTWSWPMSTGYQLNIQVENCAKPVNLAATGATTSSINLSWQEEGTATSWEYALQPVGTGFPAGGGTAVSSTNVPLTGLPSSTGYEVYVRSNCGDGTFSSWTGPVVFNTLCEALNLPFSEGFNTASPTEFCWTVLDNNNDGDTWNMDTDFNTFEGDETASITTDGNGGQNDDWLISPTINLAGGQRLKFHYKVQSGFEPNDFEVLLSTTGIDPTDFTLELVPLTTYSNTDYVEVIVNLLDASNTPISGPVNIAWHVPAGGEDGWNLFVDNVIIEDIPSCPDPLQLTASNITATAATLSWQPGYIETQWEVVVQPQGTGAPTGSGTLVSGTPTYNASPLDPSTNYEYYVRAYCAANDQSNWVGPFAFMTTQIPASLNYSQDFETLPSGWSLSNGSQTNQWVVGTAVSNGGTHSLYISNDNGTTNAYNNSAFTVAHAYRDIIMPNPVDQVSVSFDWKNVAEPCCDFLRVWAVPATFVPTPGTDIDASSGGVMLSPAPGLNQNGNWTTENYVFEAGDYQGQVVRFVFEWHNDGSIGADPAAVDNVVINVITCPSPVASSLAASNIGLNTATITWDGPSSTTPTYDYYYSLDNTSPNASTVPSGNVNAETVNLTGLQQSSIYYVWVRSNCGSADGNSFWVGPLEFHTQCGPFTVPFLETFDSNSSSEFCWTVLDVNGDGDQWNMNTTFNQFEGDECASINTDFNNGDNDDWLISPTLTLNGNQRLRFRYKVNSSSEPNDMEVLVSTTGTNPSAFTTTIIPLTAYDNTDYQQSTTNMTGISGQVNIAFHIPQGGLDGWNLFIDNVIVEDIPPCPEPLNVEISCLSSTGANFTWEAGGTETTWEVAIIDAGDPMPTSGTIVNNPVYFTDDLDAETAYTFVVRAVCPGDLGVGAWVTMNFETPTTSVQDANPFCASNDAITFENTSNGAVQDYGPVACLFSTPNPVWYYLQVDTAGDLNFQLIQNTNFDDQGNPVGTGLDVDFVAYGPFTSLTQACGEIVLEQCNGCPNNTFDPNYYPFGNIVDCSYDAAYIEHFTIHDAQPGELYAVLITNFSGQPGEIQLEMLDTSTGTTNCNILYEVALGEDQLLCGVNETTITANVTTPGNSQPPQYQWTRDGQPYTPTVVSTTDLSQTIQVTGQGTHVYNVVVTVDNAANTEPITDEITIVMGPQVAAVAPQQYVLCDDELNDGIGEFNLNTLNSTILGSQDASQFTVTYYETENGANTQTGAITTPGAYVNTTANTQTIYAAVTSNVAPGCFAVVPVTISITPLPVTNMPAAYNTCEGVAVALTGAPGNYNPADATYAWFFNGAPINGVTTISYTTAEAGIYTLQTTVNGCTSTVETQLNITPTPEFTLSGPYNVCDADLVTIQLENVQNFDPQDPGTVYVWTLDGNVLANENSSSIDVPAGGFGTYAVTITTVSGCVNTATTEVTQDVDAVALGFESGCEDNIYMLEVTAIEGSFNPDNATIVWTDPNGAMLPSDDIANIIPSMPGMYTVTITTPEGCVGTEQFTVPTTSCMIQKGISPNNDDKNDSFDLSGLNVTNLSIFNRYGQEVYTFGNYTNQWHGQSKNGDELPTGTYFYSIKRANGENHTGWVYINREEN